MPYTYDYPHPAVTADAIPLIWRGGRLQVLLIRRGAAPFEGQWAFPGGFIGIDEDLHDAARRELGEETGIVAPYVEQLQAFGRPGRDPRERVITIAFLAPLPGDDRMPAAGASDAAAAAWFAADEPPPLAFDHRDILATALTRLRERLSTGALALRLMPARFTARDVDRLYQALLDAPVPAPHFDQWRADGLIIEDGAGYMVQGRPDTSN